MNLLNNPYVKYSIAVFTALFVLSWFHASPAVVSAPKVFDKVDPPVTLSTLNNKTKTVVALTPAPSRTVNLYGPIGMSDDNSTEVTIQRILELGQSTEPMFIRINSPGGSVLDGSLIISAMEAAKGPVYTICEQLCASTAALIFEYGTTRYSIDRSFLMFHPASGGASGEIDKVASRIGSIQRYVGKLEAHVAKRAGLTFGEYKAKSGVELWIDGSDAVDTGFADSLASVYVKGTVVSNASVTNKTLPPSSPDTNFRIDWITPWFQF